MVVLPILRYACYFLAVAGLMYLYHACTRPSWKQHIHADGMIPSWAIVAALTKENKHGHA